MEKLKFVNYFVIRALLLIFPLLITPSSVLAGLPNEGFPLGRSDLPEVRAVKELRPGLTHVHVERGAWPEGGPPKVAFTAGGVQRDRSLLVEARRNFEQAGFEVTEHKLQHSPEYEAYYMLTAGEFESAEAARQLAPSLPFPVQLSVAQDSIDWDTGPYILDIVIVDPKIYRGKIVTAWSENAWRASPLELAVRDNAVVAINGSWFEYIQDGINGVPSGISIVKGEWHHEPNSRARSIQIDNEADGGISFTISDNIPPLPELKWIGAGGGKRSVTLDGIDRMPKTNELIAMRSDVVWSSILSHFWPDGVRKAQLAENGLLSWALMPKGGLVLMATGTKQAILTEAAGTIVDLDLKVLGRPGLNVLYTAHPLILNGERVGNYWGLPPDPNLAGRLARTMMGADAGGRIYLISVTGNSYSHPMSTAPSGATLGELQDIAEFLGLTTAGNLDGGGGSTSMVIEGEVVDFPHFRIPDEHRRVADSVLVIDEER